MIEGWTIVLTGGAGFIGTSLALRLVDKNRVVIFDNFHRDALAREPELAQHPNLRVVKGDVRDRAAIDQVVQGADAVVHLAAIAGVDTVMKHPVMTMQVSLQGTFNVLDAAWKTGTVKRFVDFSTSEVFGRYAYNVGEGDVTQLGAVGEARWTYAVSKLATEHLAHTYFKEHGFPAVTVRPFNIYGPRQVGEGAIHHFILRALRGEPLLVHNDGSQIRSWCYIDDIVEGVVLTLARPEAVGHVFNIGNPRSTVTIHHLARDVVRVAGSTSEIRFEPWPFADVELRVPNIDKARSVLGYEPRVDLDEGLARTLDWYRRQLP
jgi:nucleoside-diphosphate-sugar epimerase